jgi:hypothetical protein
MMHHPFAAVPAACRCGACSAAALRTAPLAGVVVVLSGVPMPPIDRRCRRSMSRAVSMGQVSATAISVACVGSTAFSPGIGIETKSPTIRIRWAFRPQIASPLSLRRADCFCLPSVQRRIGACGLGTKGLHYRIELSAERLGLAATARAD